MILLTKHIKRYPLNLSCFQKRSILFARNFHTTAANTFKMSDSTKFNVTRPKFEDRLNPFDQFSLERLQKGFTPKSIDSTRITSMHSANTEWGNEFMTGGDILARIDLIAGFAIRKLGGLFICPTRSMDAVHFLVPVKKGSLLIFKSHINRVWNTSLEVAVSVETDDGNSGLKLCCSCLLTFVLVKGPLDGEGKLRLPQVFPVGEAQTRCFEESHKRRIDRLKSSNSTSEEISIFRNYIMNGSRVRENPTFCEMVELVLPTYANAIESTFGGQIMKWMESCAGISAGRLSKNRQMISASSDAIQFVKPSRVGDTMVFRSVVTRSFNSSMEVYVVVTRFPKGTDQEEFTNDGFFTFVEKTKLSSDGISKEFNGTNAFTPSTKEEVDMFNSADKRRNARLNNLRMLKRAKM